MKGCTKRLTWLFMVIALIAAPAVGVGAADMKIGSKERPNKQARFDAREEGGEKGEKGIKLGLKKKREQPESEGTTGGMMKPVVHTVLFEQNDMKRDGLEAERAQTRGKNTKDTSSNKKRLRMGEENHERTGLNH